MNNVGDPYEQFKKANCTELLNLKLIEKIHQCKYTKGMREDINLAGEIYAYKFEHNRIPSYFLFVAILG